VERVASLSQRLLQQLNKAEQPRSAGVCAAAAVLEKLATEAAAKAQLAIDAAAAAQMVADAVKATRVVLKMAELAGPDAAAASTRARNPARIVELRQVEAESLQVAADAAALEASMATTDEA
jgi:hypothetical protein